MHTNVHGKYDSQIGSWISFAERWITAAGFFGGQKNSQIKTSWFQAVDEKHENKIP